MAIAEHLSHYALAPLPRADGSKAARVDEIAVRKDVADEKRKGNADRRQAAEVSQSVVVQ
jgi:hypothetical protein